MNIIPTFSFPTGTSQADQDQFKTAVNAVIAEFDSWFTNQVTLNIQFVYGQQWDSNLNTYTNIDVTKHLATNLSAGYTSQTGVKSYSDLLNALNSLPPDPLRTAAYSHLAANNPFGNDRLTLHGAQAQFLFPNLVTPSKVNGFDAIVGIASNAEVTAAKLKADWTGSTTNTTGPFTGSTVVSGADMIGAIEHEISEVMGRTSLDGSATSWTDGSFASYTLMDLFRYHDAGKIQTDNTKTAYFSVDAGVHPLLYWNNRSLSPDGDYGDWADSGPGGVDPTPADAGILSLKI